MHSHFDKRASWSSFLDKEWAWGTAGIRGKGTPEEEMVANYLRLRAREGLGKEPRAGAIAVWGRVRERKVGSQQCFCRAHPSVQERHCLLRPSARSREGQHASGARSGLLCELSSLLPST